MFNAQQAEVSAVSAQAAAALHAPGSCTDVSAALVRRDELRGQLVHALDAAVHEALRNVGFDSSRGLAAAVHAADLRVHFVDEVRD